MQKQDFYGLPRSIQDRFIEASLGASAPLPLGFSPERQNGSWAWGLAALLVAGLWAAFTSYGLGELNSSFAISNTPQRLVHVALAVLATFLASCAYARSWVDARVPYRPGTYLFPGVIIQASLGQLVVHEFNGVTSVKAVGSDVVVSLGSTTFRFFAGSPDLASIAAQKTEVGIERWKASDKDDHLERARLSPLVDSGIHNPLAPTQPHFRPSFVGVPVLAVISLIIGLGAGYGVAIWRDSLSQKALYKAAISQNSVDAYRAYIARGGQRPEVKSLLLPRAELERAIATGSVSAIEEFIQKNPNTEIAGEVHNALRAALLVELEKAKKVGTLKALTEYPQRYKDHQLVQTELAAARHDIYVRALAHFKETSSGTDPSLVPFVEQVIAYAERHGPRLLLRITQDFSQDPESLDQIVIKNHEYYMGVKSHPSRYFVGESARRRERELLEQVRAKLQAAFPVELIQVEIAPLPSAANEALPAPDVPTITFMHREKLSGGYVGGKPKAMYLGVAVTMNAIAQMPGADEPAMRFDWSSWRNPDFSILVDPKKDMPDVYEAMIGGAFATFTEKYLERW